MSTTYTTHYHDYDDLATTTTSTTTAPALDQHSRGDQLYFDYFILSLYLLTAVVAMLGNAFVMYVIHTTPKFKSTTFTLLFNMAISDFGSGLVIVLQWIFCSYYIVENSPRICVLNKSFQILSYYISTYSMAFIAIERYILIKHPHSKGLMINKYLACAITWIVGVFFSSTTLFNMRINEYFGPKHLITCRIAYPVDGQLAFVLRKYRIGLLIVSQFLIPLVVIICLYSVIWRIIHQREMVGNQADSMKQKQFSKNKQKLIKMLIVVVIAFIIAWLPTHLIHFFNFYIHPFLPKSCNAGTLYNLAYWLSISSCSFNVFIYYYGNPDFKREALVIYCKVTGKKMQADVRSDESKEISNTATSTSQV